ncbi:MAG TPA: uroporphyrinogen decarboxylase, partial [Verrucomicrobiales bacterium]|nr:uroporphyrinogen decarboxylase [Verrucomicrobiales bacterium]
MTSRERFLATIRREKTDRTPVWVMRQAGRYLPEYLALKEKYSFIEMAQTPELATQVTLQPLKRFPLDA